MFHVFRQQYQSVQQYSGLQEVGKEEEADMQDMLRDNLQVMDVSWEEAKSVTQCSNGNRRI